MLVLRPSAGDKEYLSRAPYRLSRPLTKKVEKSPPNPENGPSVSLAARLSTTFPQKSATSPGFLHHRKIRNFNRHACSTRRIFQKHRRQPVSPTPKLLRRQLKVDANLNSVVRNPPIFKRLPRQRVHPRPVSRPFHRPFRNHFWKIPRLPALRQRHLLIKVRHQKTKPVPPLLISPVLPHLYRRPEPLKRERQQRPEQGQHRK